MNTKEKICLFGGTFDPPHIGHLLVAQTIFEAEKFDKIVFIPTFKTPDKDNVTNIKDRLAMLTMAVTSNPNFEICDIEINRGEFLIFFLYIPNLQQAFGLTVNQHQA